MFTAVAADDDDDVDVDADADAHCTMYFTYTEYTHFTYSGKFLDFNLIRCRHFIMATSKTDHHLD